MRFENRAKILMRGGKVNNPGNSRKETAHQRENFLRSKCFIRVIYFVKHLGVVISIFGGLRKTVE